MGEKRAGGGNVIVVGTDLGPAGAEAMREALRMVRQLPTTQLHVVYAVPHEDGSGAWAISRLSGRHERARGMLARHVAKICREECHGKTDDAAIEEVMLHVRIGNAASSVHQIAIDYEADFIVVGTRKRNSVMRWLEGSVSQELARTAHCPVVIAHAKDYRGLRRSESVAPPPPGAQHHLEVQVDFDDDEIEERPSREHIVV